MICDFCGARDATGIYLEHIGYDGNKQKLYICLNCAKQRGISSDPKSIQVAFSGLLKELKEKKILEKAQTDMVCPVCGMHSSSFDSDDNLGCPECYLVFKDIIDKKLENRGIPCRFTGKMPKRLARFRSVLNDRILLKNKLDDAIKNEDFEKAAVYRDYLRALSSKSISSTEDIDELSIKE